jgi:hypothetical protein
MAGIEFVDEPGPPPPADDVAIPPDDRPAGGRMRRPLRWAVPAAAALALVAWTLVRPHGGPTAHREAPSPAPTAPTPSASPSVFPGRQAPFQHCPRYAMCEVSPVVPAAVVDAVRRQFPHGTVQWTSTVQGRRSGATEPVLLRRRLDVATADWTLEVSVAVDRGSGQLGSVPWRLSLTAPSYAHLTTEAAGFMIDVVWLGPAGVRPPDQRLHRLATDPALVLPA